MKHLFFVFAFSMLAIVTLASSGTVAMQRGSIEEGWNGGNQDEIPIPQVTYDDNTVSISCDSLLHDVQVVIKDEDGQIMYSGMINLTASVQMLNVPQTLNQRRFSIELFAREADFYGYFSM